MIATASNAFGFELWKTVGSGNMALSPASIAATLAMTWLGARGETAAQMRDVLHLDGDATRVAAEWGALARSLASSDPALTLRVANRLFGAHRYAFERAYLDLLATAFDAELEPIDVRDAEAARRHINGWVAEHTDRKIPELLASGIVNANTRLVLVNAIYFLGLWALAFDAKRTTNDAFWTSPNQSKPVPTMHRTASYRLMDAEDASMLELPYRDKLAMYVVLPNAKGGLAKLERSLDAATFASWIDRATRSEVAVALPRFTIAPRHALEIEEMLPELGMRLPFDAGRADFTGIAAPASRGDELFLAAVVHQAFVKVDEHGTVATAATAAAMQTRGLPPRPRSFTADHPFLFAIADKTSSLVLFIGRVVDPTG